MNAITDTELKVQGVEALIDALGEVMAEKFITLISREPFDYTEWQRNLWNDKSVEEISQAAVDRRLRSKRGASLST
ncbi:hypothetical protein [uncultured Thiodictyon sp.]|jgi:hypothetical protein|uniref:hypothetical protein n=1 Tax=uncultured Thiodictyon sp. TaxID=1846217 RepID=UPI0025EB70C5|nr:hypothetical protein [uncultured Thiodictyon sp.]